MDARDAVSPPDSGSGAADATTDRRDAASIDARSGDGPSADGSIPPDDGDDSGCSCTVGRRAPRPTAAWILLALAVGRLGDPRLAMEAVDSGKTDFVALGRSLIADPQWVAKARGNVPVRRCLACNTCVDEMRGGNQLGCVVNPAAAHEIEYSHAAGKPKGRRIAVIGGVPQASLTRSGCRGPTE